MDKTYWHKIEPTITVLEEILKTLVLVLKFLIFSSRP